jgi:hypothetical protein
MAGKILEKTGLEDILSQVLSLPEDTQHNGSTQHKGGYTPFVYPSQSGPVVLRLDYPILTLTMPKDIAIEWFPLVYGDSIEVWKRLLPFLGDTSLLCPPEREWGERHALRHGVLGKRASVFPSLLRRYNHL